MDKKYEFTGETLEWCRRTLHQIKALRDFGDVKAGDIGGFIEKEENLSHDGNCWVYESSIVYNDAEIRGNAIVFGNNEIRDYSIISGNTKVGTHVKVSEYVEIDNAEINGVIIIKGNAKISGNAVISGYAVISGKAIIKGNAEINKDSKISEDVVISWKTEFS